MHRTIKPLVTVALTFAALSVPGFGYAQGGVSVSLTASRVGTSGGREVVAPADQAKPGETIEYRATYRNAGAAPVRQLFATLPIPAGTDYLPRTARPARVEASLDGRTYEPVPLKRAVRLADGRRVMREVPASEYRFLRWNLGTLDARAQQDVRARVKVADASLAAARP